MKKFLLVCLVSISGVLQVQSQKALQNQVSPKEYKPYEIKLKASAIKHRGAFFFSIIDERTDTTRLGFMKDGTQQIYFHFKQPGASYLSDKINADKKNLPADTLLLVLHKLWVYESFLPRKGISLLSDRDYKILCFGRVAADIYKGNKDGRQLILSYDSSISTNGYMANNVDYLLEKNLSILLQKADSLATTSNGANVINKDKTGASAMPAILNASVYKDGIYLNYESFLNNDPAEIGFDYKVRKRKESIQLIQRQPGDSIYTEYNWGFCKNGEIYVRVGDSFSKLTKIENSFELRAVDLARFYQYEGLRKQALATAGLTWAILKSPAFLLMDLADVFMPSKTERYENISAFKLDLETGEFY